MGAVEEYSVYILYADSEHIVCVTRNISPLKPKPRTKMFPVCNVYVPILSFISDDLDAGVKAELNRHTTFDVCWHSDYYDMT